MGSTKTTVWSPKVLRLFKDFEYRLAFSSDDTPRLLAVSDEEARDIPEAVWAHFHDLFRQWFYKEYGKYPPRKYTFSAKYDEKLGARVMCARVEPKLEFEILRGKENLNTRAYLPVFKVPRAWFNNCK